MIGGVRECALDRLRGSRYFAHRDIGCDFRDGVLTLRGSLRSYYLKQLAQTMVVELDGVTSVVNHIEVVAPEGRGPKLGAEAAQ